MANFFGSVQGKSEKVTRLGTTSLQVTAQSEQGDIIVHLLKTSKGNRVQINIREHNSSQSVMLYDGLISDLMNMEHRAAAMHALGIEKFLEAHR